MFTSGTDVDIVANGGTGIMPSALRSSGQSIMPAAWRGSVYEYRSAVGRYKPDRRDLRPAKHAFH